MTGFKKLIDKIRSLEERVAAVEGALTSVCTPRCHTKPLEREEVELLKKAMMKYVMEPPQKMWVGVDPGPGDDKTVVSVLEINDLGVPQLKDYCSGWNTLSEDPDQPTVVTIKEGE